jgi:hypothetical protein
MYIKGNPYRLNTRCEIRFQTGCGYQYTNVLAKYIGITIRPGVGIPEYAFDTNLTCPNCGRKSDKIFIISAYDEQSMEQMKAQMLYESSVIAEKNIP